MIWESKLDCHESFLKIYGVGSCSPLFVVVLLSS